MTINDSGWTPTPPDWHSVFPAKPRQDGEWVWQMTKDNHTMACVLFNDERSGAGWAIVLKVDGVWLFGGRWPDEGSARFVASGLRQHHVNQGWIEQEGGTR